MSAIFKNRRVPKHLIIHDEYEPRGRSRFGLLKAVLWLAVLLLLTGAVLMATDRTLGLF
ncbi:MAG TPA: hypothetical protein VNR18_03230 [Hyphomicrobiales bacterium]|nr:hypothetical protein [Hyphomicrobiales bacterium]